MQILLVEDDRSLANGLCKALQNEGFVTNHVALGKDALHVVATDAPDIVVLDLGLPDIDGLEVLRKLRRLGSVIPVLVLTARSSVDARVSGLDEGADDYLSKPFEIPVALDSLPVATPVAAALGMDFGRSIYEQSRCFFVSVILKRCANKAVLYVFQNGRGPCNGIEQQVQLG